MILKYFSDYLKNSNKPQSFETLFLWLKERIYTPAKKHEDKILQAELYIATNKYGRFCIIAKNERGRKLLQSLYNYILSFEHLKEAREQNNK